jgi:hypothetical protein
MKPDVNRLTRELGLTPRWDVRGKTRLAQRITLKTAYKLCKMLGGDPVDFDI